MWFIQKKERLRLKKFPNLVEMIERDIKESSIDFPSEGLLLEIWDKTENGEYRLKKEVKEEILEILDQFENGVLLDLAEEIRIVGSICSNQYSDEADIDVHIVPKEEELAKVLSTKEFTDVVTSKDIQYQKKIIKWFNENREEIGGSIEGHPVEVYLQLNAIQDLMSVGVYDLMKDEWIKKPTLSPTDVSPYDSYAEIMDAISDTVKDADLLFGELKRDIIDYDTIHNAIDKVPKELRAKLKQHLEDKLKEIEQSIEELSKHKAEWAKNRRDSSAPLSSEEALQDAESAKKWEEANVVFKLLSRYKYLRVISDLEKSIKDDGEVTHDEMDLIKKAMK
jgi:hypothetical protein